MIYFFNTHRFLVEMKSYISTVSIIRKMVNFVEIFHIGVTVVILKEITLNGSLQQHIFKNN